MIGFFNEVDPARCGGKGKNLAILSKAGFPVPPGFVITVEAYTQYESEGKNTFPDEIAQQVLENYHQLKSKTGTPIVSVRSSASAEDMPNASFAGQYETYLYVQKPDEILQHIRDCWDSLWSERATLYRKLMKIPEKGLKMAVVIQTMIEPKSAGILFTKHAHPHKPEIETMIIESNWGCGESVVSGQATPDQFIVSKQPPYTVLKKQMGEKEILHRGSSSGSIALTATEQQRNQYSLTDNEIANLCRLGDKIQSYFGKPQDIEWAIGPCSTSYILQSRPITKS